MSQINYVFESSKINYVNFVGVKPDGNSDDYIHGWPHVQFNTSHTAPYFSRFKIEKYGVCSNLKIERIEVRLNSSVLHAIEDPNCEWHSFTPFGGFQTDKSFNLPSVSVWLTPPDRTAKNYYDVDSFLLYVECFYFPEKPIYSNVQHYGAGVIVLNELNEKQINDICENPKRLWKVYDFQQFAKFREEIWNFIWKMDICTICRGVCRKHNNLLRCLVLTGITNDIFINSNQLHLLIEYVMSNRLLIIVIDHERISKTCLPLYWKEKTYFIENTDL